MLKKIGNYKNIFAKFSNCYEYFDNFLRLIPIFDCIFVKKFFQIGFLAFAADVYGKGVRGKTREESFALMKPYRENRSTMLKTRLLAAVNYVKSLSFVDTNKARLYDDTHAQGVGQLVGGVLLVDRFGGGGGYKGHRAADCFWPEKGKT